MARRSCSDGFGGYGLVATGDFFAPSSASARHSWPCCPASSSSAAAPLGAGIVHPPAALGVVILMAVAVFAVHLPMASSGRMGGFEYPLMWGLIALAIFFRGGGRLSLDHLIRREF